MEKRGDHMETKEQKTVKGTRTEHNLMAAFAGESQARNRYTYYAGVAKKEGFEQIAAIFIETADNEKEHAKRFFKFLAGTPVEITSMYPSSFGDTAHNLAAAASGENEEWSELYPKFADIAKEEGFADVANAFRKIAEVEKQHEARYLKLLSNVELGKVFLKSEKIEWKCRNCGYIYTGESSPQACPACIHPQSYFESLCENY